MEHKQTIPIFSEHGPTAVVKPEYDTDYELDCETVDPIQMAPPPKKRIVIDILEQPLTKEFVAKCRQTVVDLREQMMQNRVEFVELQARIDHLSKEVMCRFMDTNNVSESHMAIADNCVVYLESSAKRFKRVCDEMVTIAHDLDYHQRYYNEVLYLIQPN